MSAGQRLPGTRDPKHFWNGANGVTITGDSWGDASGPLVLLQHGRGQTRHAWKGAGERLGAAGYYAVALDARGHGDSDWAPDADYGQDVLVKDLVQIMAALGNRRAVLVGASMGGGTSLVAAAEGRVDATALVMVDTAPRLELDGASRIQDFMHKRPDGFDSLDDVAEAIASYQPHRKRPKNIAGLAKNVRLGANGKYHWHWDPRLRPTGQDLAKRRDRMEDCAKKLRIQTLLVRGGLTDMLSQEGAQEFRQLCPHAEYVNVSAAGHMIAGDRNDIFSNGVIEFLMRAVPAQGALQQLQRE